MSSTSSLTPPFSTASLSEQISVKIFARKEIIPLRNEVLWRIDRGAVRTLTWAEDGTYITLGYWGPGDLIGSPLCKINPYQIECITSVEVGIIPSYIWHQYIESLFFHIQQSEELLSIVHLKPISLRLWKFLLWLSEKFGRNVDQDKVIDLNITHQEIAEVLNTTRVTITRLLQQFEEEGLLLRYKRRIILRLPNKFTTQPIVKNNDY